MITSLVVSLVLTLIIELSVSLIVGVRKRNDIITIIAVNFLTNPLVVLLASITKIYGSDLL